MPDTVCPLCKSTDNEHLAGKVRFDYEADVYKCRQCGLTFLDQDSFKYPDGFYENDYHQTYITHVEPDAFDPPAYFEKMIKATAPWGEMVNEMLTGKERVLDVGCSTGHFMELIKDKCAHVAGHDLNEKEVEYCRNVRKLDVDRIPLNERFEQGSFDYITMIYVLEHIADPVGFLGSLKSLLKPGGKFVILVPNVRDALVNFFDIPEFRSFYYCIEHLYYYDQHTISQVFEKAGLSGSVETLQEYPITNHLNWAYRRAPSDTLAARKGVPDVDLTGEVPVDKWEALWESFNAQYKKFLGDNGFGDRLWCVVGE